MLPDPIYTYTALAFVAGVVVGIALCGDLLRRANKQADSALSMLNDAIEREKRVTELYQSAMRTSDKVGEALRRLDGGQS